jgi:hypothetical protein
MSKNLVRMTTKSQYRVTNIPLAVYDPILGQYEKTTIDSLEHFLRNELQGVVTVDSLQQTKSTLVARVSAPASIADRVITLSGHRLHVGDHRGRPMSVSWHMIGYVSGLPELLAQNANMAISVLQAMLNSVESENYVEVRHLRYDPTVLKLFADVEGTSTGILETIKRRSFACCGGVVRIKPSVQMNRSGPTAPLSSRAAPFRGLRPARTGACRGAPAPRACRASARARRRAATRTRRCSAAHSRHPG